MKSNNTKKSLLFVGLNTVDLQFLVPHFPEANSKIKAEKNEICAGGPATNAAITCAYLGDNVDLLTPLGTHNFSGFVRNEIEKYRVKIIDPVLNQSTKPVFASIITSKHNGERTVFSYHPQKRNSEKMELVVDVAKYDIVMFDGFYPEFALPIAKKCRKIGVPTVFDGGSWKDQTEELLDCIDIAICSNDFYIPGSKVPDDIFTYLHKKGAVFAAITRGENGILYSSSGTKGEIDVKPVNAIDTLGAGDIFHGAFCHFYAAGLSYTESLYEASIIAGKSCMTFGTRQWMKKMAGS